jgi:transposase
VSYGEHRVWSEVRVPTVAQEAARQVSRERSALVAEQTRLRNQLRGWLTTGGTKWPARRQAAWWTRLRDWAGEALPQTLQDRIARADARLTIFRPRSPRSSPSRPLRRQSRQSGRARSRV